MGKMLSKKIGKGESFTFEVQIDSLIKFFSTIDNLAKKSYYFLMPINFILKINHGNPRFVATKT